MHFPFIIIFISLALLQVQAGAQQISLQAPVRESNQNGEIGQIVETASGRVQGHASRSVEGVEEFLGIRYAKAPVGELRFAKPVEYRGSDEGEVFVAENYSPLSNTKEDKETMITKVYGSNCVGTIDSIEDLTDGDKKPDFGEYPGLERYFSGMGPVRGIQGEDCLSLNIWTKGRSRGSGELSDGEKNGRGKAMLLWIHGGAFSVGSSDSKAYDGSRIVEENDVVIVSINYRLNIFGFPGMPGLVDYNVGLLDQRMAVEWTRDNIAAFGGDPTRITLFGESAGGASVDPQPGCHLVYTLNSNITSMYSYIWRDDPIAHAFIPQSGAAGIVKGDPITSAKNWFKVSQELGCGGFNEGFATIDCMRQKHYTAIIKAMNKNGTSMLGSSGLSFGPTVDNETVFADYGALDAAGKFAKKPVLVGNTDNEAGLMDIMSKATTGKGINRFKRAAINKIFTCPASFVAQARSAKNLPTWQYRYFGDYPNTRISNNSGAYHSSEIPMVFGTTGIFGGSEDTEIEKEMGKLIRRAWSVFAKDPVEGLTRELGWPKYDAKGDTLIRLGFRDETQASFVKSTKFDIGCGFGRMILKYFGDYLMKKRGGKSDKEEL